MTRPDQFENQPVPNMWRPSWGLGRALVLHDYRLPPLPPSSRYWLFQLILRILLIFDVFQTMFIDFDTISSFDGLKMEADILARRDGGGSAVRRPRFFSKIHLFCFFFKFTLFRKNGLQHFCQKQTVMMGFWGIFWGKMSVMTAGSFQVSRRIVTLTDVLQVKVHAFPKTSICIVSV